ncbi:MAG TPA: hypothetical protein VFL17_23220 [Anaerolineae bacterium]|nr:hypothetical protein [Anaerolineae bacterium]
MRKVLAVLLIIFLVFPMILATLSTIAVSTWVLDRDFYTDLAGDPRLYEVLLSEDLPNYFGRRIAVREVDGVPARALSQALREVVTPEYLAGEATRIVDQVFSVIEGESSTLMITLDIAPLKSTLRGEAGRRFAQTLAANLPACAAGQESRAPGGTIIRCLPSNVSVEEATGMIVNALPAFLDEIPDQIELARDRVYLSGVARGWNTMTVGQGALNFAILILVLITGGLWLAAALIGGEDRREQLLWLGWSLLVPAVLIFALGLLVGTDFSAGWVRFGLNQARFGDVEYSDSFRLALLDVARTALDTVANGFLMAGGVAGGIAIGLIAWGYTTPKTRRMVPAVAPVTSAQPPSSPQPAAQDQPSGEPSGTST